MSRGEGRKPSDSKRSTKGRGQPHPPSPSPGPGEGGQGARSRPSPSDLRLIQVIRCDHDGLKMAEVKDGHLILRDKHHGETHVKIVPLAELVEGWIASRS